MNRLEKIESALQKAFPDCEYQLTDNSRLHKGHIGAQNGKGHFELTITASALTGKKRLEQHRLIFQALDELMKTEIHALEIHVN